MSPPPPDHYFFSDLNPNALPFIIPTPPLYRNPPPQYPYNHHQLLLTSNNYYYYVSALQSAPNFLPPYHIHTINNNFCFRGGLQIRNTNPPPPPQPQPQPLLLPAAGNDRNARMTGGGSGGIMSQRPTTRRRPVVKVRVSRGRRFSPSRRRSLKKKKETAAVEEEERSRDALTDGGGERTSLMIRNIPNHFQRGHLMQYLDRHCAEENRKEAAAPRSCSSTGGPTRGGLVVSEYDFLYLPMDFRTGANLGYAFVNFTSCVGASRFCQSFDSYEWNVSVGKRKVCRITNATIQGKEALVDNFKDSRFNCHRDYYLPVVFSPPRNGSNRSNLTVVGQRGPAGYPSRIGMRRSSK